jgi:hypothetical protein
MKYYYANAANQPAGPVTLDELRQLLARGEISSVTNIIPVGDTVWRPLSTLIPAPAATPVSTPSITPAAPAAPSTIKPADVAKLPTILATFVGGLIAKARALLNIPRLNCLFSGANSIGQVLVLVGAALALIYGIVYAIKYDSFEIFLYGIASVLLLAVLQFVAQRLLDACASVLKSSPTRVASVAVLECLGLLLLLGAIGVLTQGVITSIQVESALPLVPALALFVILVSAAGVALHPSLANVDQGTATAGEEAIGLFSFFAKTSLVLQPLLFAVYTIAGIVVILFSLFGRDTGFAESLMAVVPFAIPGTGGMIGVSIIAAACLFPLFGYLGFLAYYLIVDVLRAILAVPAKLDQLRR